MLFALSDRRTPTPSKLVAVAALAYALLPLDLLPDVTPLLGVADDVLIVPTLLALAARALPAPVLNDAHTRTQGLQRRLPWLVPGVIGAVLLGMTLLGWMVWQGLK